MKRGKEKRGDRRKEGEKRKQRKKGGKGRKENTMITITCKQT